VRLFSRLRIPVLICLVLVLLSSASVLAADYSYPSGWSEICSEESWQVLARTNKARIGEGLLPLSVFPTLQHCANVRAGELTSCYDHARPDGRRFYTVLEDYGLCYYKSAENIAWGQSTAGSVVSAWMNSSGHYANIMNDVVTHAGMGNAYDYWGQLFMWDKQCAFSSLQVVKGEKDFHLRSGESLDDLGAAVAVTCAKHGTCYMPLIEEMCSAVNTWVSGQSTVTVRYGSLRTSFQVDVTAVVQSGDLAAEIVDNAAVITEWNGSEDHPDVVVPAYINGYPVTTIGTRVFYGAELNSITLPETLKTIEEEAFAYCMVDEVRLPDGLTTIGKKAFWRSGVKGVFTLPDSVRSLGTAALAYQEQVTAFAISGTGGSFEAQDGVLYSQYGFSVLAYPPAREGDAYVLGMNVVAMGDGSFAGVSHLKNLYVHSSDIRIFGEPFPGSDFRVWAKPDSHLYSRLASGALNTSVSLGAMPICEVETDGNAIYVELCDNFFATSYLAAYDDDGKLVEVVPVVGLAPAVYTLPGSDRVSSVCLFRLNKDAAPHKPLQSIWDAGS